MADRPDGIVLQVITPIVGSGDMGVAHWMRGVRIHSESNTVVRLFGTQQEALHSFDLSMDREPGEPAAAVGDGAPPPAFGSHMAYGTSDDHSAEIHELAGDAESALALMDGDQYFDFTLLSIGGWPETKTEWEIKCIVKIGGKCRVRTKVPVVYHRTSTLKFIATVCIPTEDNIRGAVEDCVRQAIAAGVITGIATGSVSAAAAALTAYLKTCLAAKGVAAANRVSVHIHEDKVVGPWKRV